MIAELLLRQRSLLLGEGLLQFAVTVFSATGLGLIILYFFCIGIVHGRTLWYTVEKAGILADINRQEEGI